MNSYVLILIADVLLAITLAFQKKYERKAGTSVRASLVYSILSGIFSAAIFLAVNRFTVNVTCFSVIMACMFSVVLIIYVFAGFCIMEKGNVSIYTMFLMAGGMVVPYIYGVAFLNEQLTAVRIFGILLIAGAIIIGNFTVDKIDKKQFFLCLLVFVLNGTASVISKAHQISSASKMVTSSDFVFLVMVSKAIISFAALFFIKVKKTETTVGAPLKSVVLIVFLASAADGTSYMLQLMGAVKLPATVLYPLVTGGTIILSSLVDFVIYKQKLSPRQWVGAGVSFLGTLMFL